MPLPAERSLSSRDFPRYVRRERERLAMRLGRYAPEGCRIQITPKRDRRRMDKLLPELERALKTVIRTDSTSGKAGNRSAVESRVNQDCLDYLERRKYVFRAGADSGKVCYHKSFESYKPTLLGRNYFPMKRRKAFFWAFDKLMQVACGMGGGLVVWVLSQLCGN